MKKMCVCNPLTNVYWKIQIDWNVWPIKMVQGESDDEPYVVVNLKPCDFYGSCFGVYHYFQDSWKIKFQFSQRLEFRTYFGNMVACNGAIFFEAELPVTIVGYNIRDPSSIRPLEIAALRGHILEADEMNRFSITTYGLSILLIVMKIDLQEDVVILELLQDENDELLWNCREFLRIPRNSVPRCLDIGYRVSLVVGDYLCFISPYDDFLGVAYNLKQGAWHQLPQCPDGEHDKILSFQPKLRAKGCQIRFRNSMRGGGSQHLASAINNFT